MFKLFGVLVIIAGLIFAVWLGIFGMFIPGIEQIVDEINAEKADGGAVATGILKVIFAGTVASITFVGSIFLGLFLWALGDD